MNKIKLWFIRRYLYNKAEEGNKMFQLILFVLAFIAKNLALIIGVLEGVVKVLGGIISLTPTKADDKFLPVIDKVFSNIKRALYNISDIASGKEFNIYKH